MSMQRSVPTAFFFSLKTCVNTCADVC
jgi:hypothetical protein